MRERPPTVWRALERGHEVSARAAAVTAGWDRDTLSILLGRASRPGSLPGPGE